MDAAFAPLGTDPLEVAINRVLERLRRGESPNDVEERRVDLKEERGRRRTDGSIKPGYDTNEAAAAHLAEEMACFANTEGGGAILLGIADDGTRIGTQLNAEWLRHRIFELTSRRLTPVVREQYFDSIRILILTTPQAVEPIRYNDRIKWRVGANCVEVDAITWHTRTMHQRGYDWSAQPSSHTLNDVSPLAVEAARRFVDEKIRSSQSTPGAMDLSKASQHDLLNRLHLVNNEGCLTNAGSLLFVSTPVDGIDYIRREYEGADSLQRVRNNGPLILQIDEVFRTADRSNRTVHLRVGPGDVIHARQRALPTGAMREAVINGIVHRDWHSQDVTFVEHIGDKMIVWSPGSFIGGITPESIITHPPKPRYPHLSITMSTLGLNEHQGIGVDRMFAEMLKSGFPMPDIAEMDGPYVRVGLIGGDPDPELVSFLADLKPPGVSLELDILILIDVLCHRGWLDSRIAAPCLQRSLKDSERSIQRLAACTIGGEPVVTRVVGVPPGHDAAYRLASRARQWLSARLERTAGADSRRRIALDWAQSRGRVSSTELADLIGIHTSTAGRMLNTLAEEEFLLPSNQKRAGRGFHYTPT